MSEPRAVELDLVWHNLFLVLGPCRCGGHDPECDCYQGSTVLGEVDLNILLTNLAVAGALCAAYAGGWRARVDFVHNFGVASPPAVVWHPGCGREAPP